MATQFTLKLGRYWPWKTVSSHLNSIKCFPKKQNTHERRSKHKTYYITVGIREVRPLTWNYEAVLLVGKFPHRFSLRFLVYPSLLKSRINRPVQMIEYLPEIPFNLTQGLSLCTGTCGNRLFRRNRRISRIVYHCSATTKLNSTTTKKRK